MQIRALSISGAWEFSPHQHRDTRGILMETYRADLCTELIGRPFVLQQMTTSVSTAGALRGIHFTDTPFGQAKYVTCATGSIFDVVVDIRTGSPTFGKWESIILNENNRKAVYLEEGLGHAFLALEDGTTVNYLCSEIYNPAANHGIYPLDPEIGIAWPGQQEDGARLKGILSDKDANAPSLHAAMRSGQLPSYAAVNEYLRALRRRD